MTTTQSEDPNEQVDHPRWYNAHPSGVETIEIFEHLPANLATALKYVWRAGLKQSSGLRRDLESALWYTNRERDRRRLFELADQIRAPTDILWRSLARRVMENDGPNSTLSRYLWRLLDDDVVGMCEIIEDALRSIKDAS